MTLEQYNQKTAQLKAEGAELAKAGKLEEAEAKKKEIDDLTKSFEAEKAQKAEENALKDNATVPEGIREEHKLGEENVMPKILDASSVEYKNGFLKHLMGRDDAMTKLENDAFIHTTENTGSVLPTTMLNQIWDLVSQNHVIMGDVTIYRTGTILEVNKHTAVVQGKAKKVSENAANDDEQNAFVKVTLSGHDFSKSLEISYAESLMSIDAFEQYLINEISSSLGEALADDVVANAIEAKISTANRVAVTGDLKIVNVLKAFGALKRVTDPAVYCTRSTLYNNLAALEDTAGHLIYQPSATAGVPGTLLGAQVKIEDSVADGKILIGDAKKVVYNMIQDIMVESDKDIKTHKYIYSGYARGEGTLIDDQAFSEITITATA